MGFKISPFEAFDRAERIHDKVNRKIKTSDHKEPTLEEQLRNLELLEQKKREQRRLQREQENANRFTPAAAARVAYEKTLKEEEEKQAKLAERKKK